MVQDVWGNWWLRWSGCRYCRLRLTLILAPRTAVELMKGKGPKESPLVLLVVKTAWRDVPSLVASHPVGYGVLREAPEVPLGGREMLQERLGDLVFQLPRRILQGPQ